MTAPHALLFDWDGEAMIPRSQSAADRQYVVGECYRLAVFEPRSRKSHDHYFACVHDAWANLPEQIAERHPTDEHLRKWALIKAGYRDERVIVCASAEEALKMVAFAEAMDDYAIVIRRHDVVTVFTAKSQSQKAMGKKAFQESKQAVLDILSEMVGVSAQELQQNAGRAA